MQPVLGLGLTTEVVELLAVEGRVWLTGAVCSQCAMVDGRSNSGIYVGLGVGV